MKTSNVFLDFPLRLPMRDAGVPLRSAHRTVDEMLHACFLGDVGEVLTLMDLAFGANRPKILDAVKFRTFHALPARVNSGHPDRLALTPRLARPIAWPRNLRDFGLARAASIPWVACAAQPRHLAVRSLQ